MNIEGSSRVSEQIAKGLEDLRTNINGDDKRIREIVTTFLTETPLLFEQIQERIVNEDVTGAAELVHKVKVRYGYLGLDDILAELSKWEEQLTVSTKAETNIRVLEKFNKLNDVILQELKNTSHHQADQSVTKQPLEGKHVLIAEDDEINAMVFELFVKEMGASVVVATNGNEALQFAVEKSPDLIFMDVHMPFLSGLEVIKRVRSKGITCPIISLSASTRLNEKQNSLDAGANDFLVKPANRDSIKKALVKYLG